MEKKLSLTTKVLKRDHQRKKTYEATQQENKRQKTSQEFKSAAGLRIEMTIRALIFIASSNTRRLRIGGGLQIGVTNGKNSNYRGG
jgi:hypothetical protein